MHYAPEPTGNAPYTTGLAEGLARRGHDVHVIASHPHYPEWRVRAGYGGWSTSEQRNGVSLRRLRHYVPRRPTAARRLLSELSFGARLVAASWRRPDVVLLVSPALFATAPAMLRARLWGRGSRTPPTAVWVQDLYSVGFVETGQGGARSAALMRRVESATLRASDGVAVIHDRFRAVAVSSLGAAAERVEVIRNWSHVDVEPGPAHRAEVAEVRSARGWPDGTCVVVHAGNMGVKQGLDNVVEAARLADVRRAPVRFVLLGNGSQRDRLAQAAAGVRSIEFIETLADDEFPRVLAAADVLLVNELAGVNEMSVPSKLTTYFATSRPVVAATAPGSVTAGEIGASGGGVLVAAGDPGALLDSVVDLHADPVRAERLGIAGRAYRDQTLSQDAAIDHYVAWLDGLVRRQGGTA